MEHLTAFIVTGGFVLTVGGIIVAITRNVDRIRFDAEAKIAEAVSRERATLFETITKAEDKFQADQDTQDSRFGEVNKALRQYITDLEKKVFQVEIWARDRFATKDELSAAEVRQHALALAEVIKDVRHIKRNFELHQQIYKDLNDQVIRLEKDVERLNKAVNGKH
ncbi:hypothetical protein [Bradyrhizobium valentinum]|uniref:Uncharacterized protein n=1 Tax=Bradyrhizobium valentinum TaxID=1518501 RepID=A0A0R3KUV1_9BRAD|nr:hypothetical protein [Bradyrhizobium valentinum]KRQ99296.1 hypothetical protein CP49_11920 [Bradyrhizobium valentinum]